ncbi:MAG: DNA polymerase III subunit delta [Kiritimatiellae bacterium]|nr:DNA polymerase III subunit delta [Kiritimatiellia bacterium]MDD5521949.1 DNA polymerase III subunit delta [Kiritimatiellia bacterium]
MAAKVYLIYGDEYLVSSSAKEKVESLVPRENQVFGLEIIDGNADSVDAAVNAVDKCREALQTVGFMGGNKVVWFRDVNFLYDSVTGRSQFVKERVEGLAAFIKDGLPDGQKLVVTSPKVDKRYAFYKACKEAGDVHEFAVPDKAYMAEKQAMQTVFDCFKKAGLRIDEDVAHVFLVKVGTDTRQIVNEIEKLAVYLGNRKEVSANDIQAVVSSSREALAWDLADAFGKRDLKLAISVLRQLLFQKESAIGLIIALENRVRDLMIYREAIDNGWLVVRSGSRGSTAEWGDVPPDIEENFSQDFKTDPRSIHPFRVGIIADQARRFSQRELQKCRKAVLDAHEKLVSRNIPELTILEPLLVRMLS